jgi:trans-2-enoyl-CoA reductase
MRKKIRIYYRRQMILEFDEGLYHRRKLVGTAFLVLKRKYGEDIKSRKYWNHVKEIKIKLTVHNLGRYAKVVYSIQMRISREPEFGYIMRKELRTCHRYLLTFHQSSITYCLQHTIHLLRNMYLTSCH